jgi:FMN phosphatase YigB (HAD superfamily)
MTDSTRGRRVAFLIDVDNTLIDNDRIVADLKTALTAAIGVEREQRYWAIFEALRAELGYADYLGTLQRLRLEDSRDAGLFTISPFLLNYPFAERLFPGALEVIGRLNKIGQAVILSDGDAVFQPLKIDRSGLRAAVDGRILLYVHKEQELDDVKRRCPADHYVLIDDKVRILAAIKAAWGARVTTVFPRQGHYAHDADVAIYQPPDVTVEHIGDLLQLDSGSWTS